MSKGTTPRHSKPSQPVTIDLDATDVTPRDEVYPAAAPDPVDNGREEISATTEADAEISAASTETPDAAPDAEATASADSAAAASATSANSRSTPHLGRAADQPAASGGFKAGSLLGGVGGGALAFLVLYGLQAGGILPAPGGNASEASSTVSALGATVESLQQQVAQLSSTDGDGALTSISDRLSTLEQQIDAASTSGAANQALGEIDARVAELGKRLDELAAGSPAGSGAAPVADAGMLSDLRARSNAATAAITELKGQADRLDAAVAGLEQKQAAVEQALGAVEAKVSEPGRDLDMARAIASSGLKTAIDRGGPFAAELEAFASVAPDDPAVGELRTLAATGVPTRARLVAQFPDAADAMIAAMNPVPADAGIVDRLFASAKSMVRVRKVGEVEGDSVEAIAARLEVRLTDGDLAAALAEWGKLPDQAKAAAEGFGKDLAARARVETLLRDAVLPASVAPAATADPATEPAAATDAATAPATAPAAAPAAAPAN